MKSPAIFEHNVCNADTTADLPQLFGPINTVSPRAGSISVRECDMKFSNTIRRIIEVTRSKIEQCSDPRDGLNCNRQKEAPNVFRGR